LGGWIALGMLTLLYGAAITSLFVVLPRLGGGAASTIALNFEPIAALGIAWLVLGQGVSPLQLAGAFIVVGAIAWLGAIRR
jgi:drug/metabolite transporter (DMT)-like permease